MILLLAEIHNKISRSGSNLSDQLEDKLTGDFFGALRYLPLQVVFHSILERVVFESAEPSDWKGLYSKFFDYCGDWQFWPRHGQDEIDLLVDFDDLILGIEVKYKSGLSSDDDPSFSVEAVGESKNQLLKYMKMLHRVAAQNGKQQKVYQVFLAPHAMMRAVQNNLADRLHDNPDTLGFISWETIHDVLTKLSLRALEPGHQRIVNDLIQLLEKKGLYHYQGIELPEELLDIEHAPYSYKTTVNVEKSTYSWSTQSIEKGHYYVYKR